MRQLFKRTGFWLFVAAVVWYSAGNIGLKKLDDYFLKQAMGAHANEQLFNMSGVTKVRLNGSSKLKTYVPIEVKIDAGNNQAAITNNNLGVVTEGKIENDALVVTINTQSGRQFYNGKPLVVNLPPGINQLDINELAVVTASGIFSSTDSMLSINVTGCNSTLTLHKLTLTRLNLSAACTPSHDKPCCQDRVESNVDYAPTSYPNRSMQNVIIDDSVVVTQLDLTMRTGRFGFYGIVNPERINLSVGDDVAISGRRDFLKNARYTALP